MSLDNGINGSENPDVDISVRQTEDASLQDDSYSFDESNTDDEEFHDVDDEEIGELDFSVDVDRTDEIMPDEELRP